MSNLCDYWHVFRKLYTTGDVIERGAWFGSAVACGPRTKEMVKKEIEKRRLPFGGLGFCSMKEFRFYNR